MNMFRFVIRDKKSKEKRASAQNKRHPELKKLVKKLELLHWRGRDIRVENDDHLDIVTRIWSGIFYVISANVDSAREFIDKGGLQWVYWYVVEKEFAITYSAYDKLANVFKGIMVVLSTAMVDDDGRPLFKAKYFNCQNLIVERL